MKHSIRLSEGSRRWLLLALGVAGAVVIFQVVVMPLAVRHAHDAVVPDLQGLTAAEAGRRLEQATLAEGQIGEAVDDQIAAGRIVRQSPLPGLRVRRGRKVGFIVSSGPATHFVPELTGDTIFHARFLLEREGVQIGNTRTVAHPSFPSDRILACSPPAGTPIGRRAVVHLLVSAGPPARRYYMPDLRGLDAGVAKSALEAAGLSVTEQVRSSGGDFPDEVVGQTPPPGYPVPMGGAVEILTGS